MKSIRSAPDLMAPDPNRMKRQAMLLNAVAVSHVDIVRSGKQPVLPPPTPGLVPPSSSPQPGQSPPQSSRSPQPGQPPHVSPPTGEQEARAMTAEALGGAKHAREVAMYSAKEAAEATARMEMAQQHAMLGEWTRRAQTSTPKQRRGSPHALPGLAAAAAQQQVLAARMLGGL